MPVHVVPQYLHRRQQANSDPIPIPTGLTGVSGGVTATAATPTSFVFDSAVPVSSSAENTAPALAPFASVTITTSAPSVTSSASSSSSAGRIPISMSMVIGICIATFIGLTIVVLFGIWCYKRSGRRLKRSGPRTPLSSSRNNNANNDRRRSRAKSEKWNRLDDVDFSLPEIREVDVLAPMEKFSMFKGASTPSVDKESSPATLEHHTFSPYHPNLAEELAEARRRPYLGRTAVRGPDSWDDDATLKPDSMFSKGLSKEAVSPPVSKAIPTPQVVSSVPHRWESAEVMHYESSPGKKSKNPFLRAEVVEEVDVGVKKDKGKQKATENPFGDEFSTRMPTIIAHHVANLSTSSTASNERAIRSLMEALEVSPEEVQRRLRAASMQGSLVSLGTSFESSYTDEEDVTAAFPAPPH